MDGVSVRIGPLHRELLAQLESYCTAHGGIAVVDGFVGTGEDLGRQADGETFKPTAVLVLGRPDQLDRTAGISDYASDLKAFTFSVLCIAPSNLQLTDTLDVVNAALESFQPTNCSQIELVGSAAQRSPVATFLNPARFATPTGFALTIDPVPVP